LRLAGILPQDSIGEPEDIEYPDIPKLEETESPINTETGQNLDKISHDKGGKSKGMNTNDILLIMIVILMVCILILAAAVLIKRKGFKKNKTIKPNV
jgi:hypothetical protein